MSSRFFLMIVSLLVGALVQQLLPGWPIFGEQKPPVLAALALHYAFRCEGRGMWIAVVFAMVLQDGLEHGNFGPALLTFPLFGVLGNRIRNEIFVDGIVTQLIFGAAMGLLFTLVCILIYSVTGQRPMHFGQNLMRLFGALVLGAITLPVVSIVMRKIESFLPKRRGYGWQ